MKNNTKAIHLFIEDMSASDIEALYKWIGKLLPKKTEAETPTLSSAAKWWLAKLKSGNVLPGIGWPTMLLVDDLGSDYIKAMKRDITHRGSVTAMGRFLKKVGAVDSDKPSIKPKGPGRHDRRLHHYLPHGLDKCREEFEAVYGTQDWADSDDSGDSADDAQKGDSQYPDGE